MHSKRFSGAMRVTARRVVGNRTFGPLPRMETPSSIAGCELEEAYQGTVPGVLK
jgi:hypothetical protein